MENKLKIIASSSFVLLLVMLAVILFPRKPDESQNAQYLAAMEAMNDTQLGKLSPFASVDMKTFLETAIPYLTFEHGEDSVFIATKQGYINETDKSGIKRNEALKVLFKIINNETDDENYYTKAKELNIINDKDKSLRNNIKLSASEACYLIHNTRKAWYSQLENDSDPKKIDVLKYYYTASDFVFSDNGKILWYDDEGGALNALNTQDGSFSSVTKPDEPELEKYVAGKGEKIVNIYDNANVLRAVSIEKSEREGYITEKKLLYRSNDTSPWVTFVEFDLTYSRQYEIIGFTADNSKLYVKTNFYDNYITIYEVNPVTKARQVVYRNKYADVADSVLSQSLGIPVVDLVNPESGELLSTIYVNDKAHLVCINEQFGKIMKQVNDKLGENHFPIAVTPDFKYIVLLHKDSRDLGSYILYYTDTQTYKMLATPGIPQSEIGITFPVSIKASDGETIYGYLTLPKGKSPRNLPLMVNVNGGYNCRFFWTPDANSLLAINSGLAVLSVNSRMSAGYGNEYIDSASNDLFLAQNDIYEITKWAIDTGIAKMDNIGIMGHSYGGFSAFYQAATHPELYKSVISLMGVWDWSDLGDEFAEGEEIPEYYKRFAPLPHTELAESLSPSSFADKLVCPVLIIYAADDKIVYPSQNSRAIRELEQNGNTPVTLFLADESHVPTSIKSLVEIIDEMETFMSDKSLPAEYKE